MRRTSSSSTNRPTADVDAREALVQALNGYDGAVVLVNHDRHMLELSADRLVLVDGGTAKEFSGSIEDCRLPWQEPAQGRCVWCQGRQEELDRAANAQAREQAKQMRKALTTARQILRA